MKQRIVTGGVLVCAVLWLASCQTLSDVVQAKAQGGGTTQVYPVETEQAWTMANHARAERMLAMHHSTFRLSHEPMTEPLERLMEVAGRYLDRIVAPQIGLTWSA